MLTNILVLLVVSLATSSTVRAQDAPPVVTLSQGVVSGSWQVSTGGRKYAAFQGIPYARPPVGKYRFKEPQEVSSWNGTLNATNFGNICPQFNFRVSPPQIRGNEDCLSLNVYTPQVDPTLGLPVVVFIHGGSFRAGSSGQTVPVSLMDKDIVFVAINYRLGPLGFLSTEDTVVSGNMGLKDQVFAMQWVQSNILLFGGNPVEVTLIGHSAGAASVHYHYLSPRTPALFARGMAMSGSAFAPWAQAQKPLEKARALAAKLGCPTAVNKDMVACLRNQTAESIIGAQTIFAGWRGLDNVFAPSVESTSAFSTFLTCPPIVAARSANAVPIVFSVTSDEGLLPAAGYLPDPKTLPSLEASWDQQASDILEYNDTLPVSQRSAVAAKIRQQYLQGKAVSLDTFTGLVQALTDRQYVAECGRAALLQAALNKPVYFYRYSFQGEKSITSLLTGDNKKYGVCHGDDVWVHIFDTFGLNVTKAEDLQIRKLLIDLIYSFASTGTPKVDGVTWSPVEAGSTKVNYIDIVGPGQVTSNSTADLGHLSFWTSLGLAENQNCTNTTCSLICQIS